VPVRFPYLARSGTRAIAVGAALVLLGAAPAANAAISSTPDTTYVTNGPVNAVARTANRIFLGGSFTQVGPRTGPWAEISSTTGKYDPAVPPVTGGDGEIDATVSDGAGGFYIGGSFTHVGGVPRGNLAHIRANKTLDPGWHPSAADKVRALAKSGSTVYIGGDFNGADSINGTATRNYAAAVDATTGAVKSWDPNLKDIVEALAASGSKVYIGGYFNGPNAVNGTTTRNRAAAVDTTNGTVDPNWDPNVTGIVATLAVSGSTVYLGGFFNGAHSINGVSGPTRNYAAAVDTTNGIDTGWDANLSNFVLALAVSGSKVYIGGFFHGAGSVNGNGAITRNYAAAVDPTSGTVDSGWDPNLHGPVRAIAASGGTVYLGGDFNGPNSINGSLTRNSLAAVDATSGAATAWNPNVNSIVFALAVSGSTVGAGGLFSSIGGVSRNGAAALNPADGKPTAWNPNVNGAVYSMAVSGSTVYLGGSFSGAGAINGNMAITRNRAAAVDATTGTVNGWNPNLSDVPLALVVSGSRVYIGGLFHGPNSVNGNTTRNYAATVDTTNGTVDPNWDPNLTDRAFALAVSGSKVYIGGFFHGAGSVNANGAITRNYAAAVDTTNGTVDPSWDPNLNARVFALALSGSKVYLGGSFNGAGSVNANGAITRNYAAAVDATNGTVNGWNPNLGDSVLGLAVSGHTVYIAGNFNGPNSINGNQTRNRLAAVDDATGTVMPWNPNVSNLSAAKLAVDGAGGVVVGGTFTTLDLFPQSQIAVFSALPSNHVRPKVSGTGKVGKTLACTRGTWTGSPPLAFAYRWLRNGIPIVGGTRSSYKLAGADAGRAVSCRVTAHNLGGSATATSAVVKVKPQCVVPKLKGKKLGKAKKALRAADCKLGKVKRKKTKGKPGRVISQKPRPGKVLRPHAKVAVVVSKR